MEKAKAQGISWPIEDDVNNALFGELLSDKEEKINSPYAEPDFAYIHKELSKNTLFRQEYCEKCRANGQQPYMSTQFGAKYRRWARVTNATMRITHKHSDAMQVNRAGETIPYYDTVTGEEYKTYLFVAALPCSCYIYYETHLNESYRELAEYYGTAVVPAHVRKPRDKSIVEKSVGFSTTWITVAMHERKFFSLAEVKAAVVERLDIINVAVPKVSREPP